MVKFNYQLQLVLIFILLAQMGKSFSHARRVKEVTGIGTAKKFAVHKGESNVILPKENLGQAVPNAAQIQKSTKTGGRKMSTQAINPSNETTSEVQESRNSKKGSSVGGNRKGYGDNKENWKKTIMALSADYRSPKPHPPKNN